MKKILTKKGFTLIELIVVIAILAILAAILIPSLVNYLNEAKYAKGQANTRSQYTAATLDLATDGVLDVTPVDDNGTCSVNVNAALNIDAFSCTFDTIEYHINPSTGAVTFTP